MLLQITDKLVTPLEALSEAVKAGRCLLARGADILEQSDPRYIKDLDFTYLRKRYSELLSAGATDTKLRGAAVAAAAAATTVTLAAVSWGMCVSFKDTLLAGDFRSYRNVLTWTGGAARTMNVDLRPHGAHDLYILFGFQSQGQFVPEVTTAAGPVFTVAADTIRAGSVVEVVNFCLRDLKG